MVTQLQLEQWLQEGIVAAKSGQIEQARFRLLDVVEQDQTNETAWFWLYHIFERLDDKRVCLENLVMINPHNEWARQELLNYLPSETVDRPSYRSSTNSSSASPAAAIELQGTTQLPLILLRLVAAFWLGISVILLTGGIIAAADWLVSGLRNGAVTNYVTGLQILELFVAITFVILGIIGINIAIALFSRTMVGFYGSLLLGLGLLLVGPTVSLIAAPPNYLALVCTGGISGTIVLLTLASQPALKDTS